jgi:hypothetical protein
LPLRYIYLYLTRSTTATNTPILKQTNKASMIAHHVGHAQIFQQHSQVSVVGLKRVKVRISNVEKNKKSTYLSQNSQQNT